MRFTAFALALPILVAASADAQKAKHGYQLGTFVGQDSVADGTLTDTVHGDGTTIAGDVYSNAVKIYTVKAQDGVWTLETEREASDSMMRRMGMTPENFKSERPNPLDALKNGDRLLFRVEQHHKIGGVESDLFIPSADNPDKETKFIGTFVSNSPPASVNAKPSDNVKAMCDAHKLTPEQEKQFCESAPVQPPAVPASDTLSALSESNTASVQTQPGSASTPAPNTSTVSPSMEQFKAMCDSGMFKKDPPANVPSDAQQALRRYNQQVQQQCDMLFPSKK